MSKRKRRKLWAWVYGIFLTIYAIALATAAFYALTKVWAYAEEYEASQPEPVIDAYVEDLRENLWGEGIERTLAEMPHEVQSNEDVAAIVKDMLKNEISYSRKASSGSDNIVYNLRCGDRVFGQVTLSRDQSKADEVEFGQLPWIISDEEFDFNGLYSSIEITVPATYKVELNGVELGSEYIVESGIHYDVLEDYYSAYPNLPTKVTYRFENIIGHLDPVVLDEDGQPFVIDETKDDSQYIHTVQGSEFDRLNDFAQNFGERYRSYVSGAYNPDYGYQRLAGYIRLGSDLDTRMKEAMDGLSWAHTQSVTVEWVTLNSAIDIGDGYYILDISSQTKTLQPGQGTVNNLQSMRVIAQDSGNDIRAVTLDIYQNEDVDA